MNKKELAEIRKNFSESSDLFVVNRIATAYVDSSKNVLCETIRPYHNIPSEECECILRTLKCVLKGKLGKDLLEYEFPNVEYQDGGSQSILYSALDSKLMDPIAVSDLVNKIVADMDYVSTYTILIGHCTYTAFKKSKSDEIDKYQSQEYHFLVTAICPVELRADGLVYNEDDNAIEKKNVYDRIVSEVPTDGFLYPTFTERSPDVNHVLYSAHKATELNTSIIEDVLGCKFTHTAQEQKALFLNLMQDIVSDELSYSVITDVNDRLRNLADEHKNESELMMLDDINLRDVLLDSSVSQEKSYSMQSAYKDATCDKPIALSNLVETKTTISTDGVTVSIGKGATDKVRTQCINGRRYLLIDIDGPSLDINNLTVRISE